MLNKDEMMKRKKGRKKKDIVVTLQNGSTIRFRDYGDKIRFHSSMGFRFFQDDFPISRELYDEIVRENKTLRSKP